MIVKENDLTRLDLARASKSALSTNLQDLALYRLLWCLNAGGRRKYKVIHRPDESNRTEPRPDYVCEELLTSARVTIEVCRLQWKNQDQHRATLLQLEIDVNMKLKDLSGAYDVWVYYPVEDYCDGHGSKWRTLVDQICRMVMEAERDPEYSEYVGYIVKRSNLEPGVHLLPRINEEDELVSEFEILDSIKLGLLHANKKLSMYCSGTGIALFDNMVFRIPWLPGDAEYFADEIKRDDWPSVQRCYMVGDSISTERVHRLF